MSSVYRTHTCGQLRPEHVGKQARLSGWVQRKRDHGDLLFIDLRDHYGMTQVVVDAAQPGLQDGRGGAQRERDHGHRQGRGPRGRDGEPEARHRRGRARCRRDGRAVDGRDPAAPGLRRARHYPEEMRLGYRFLDLRREQLHRNIMLRAQVIAAIRRRMIEQGFIEFQTPILTADLAPRARATILVPSPAAPGQVLRAAAGAAAVQAAADGRRASTATSRSRPASATRTPAPTARPASSTSSTSR